MKKGVSNSIALACVILFPGAAVAYTQYVEPYVDDVTVYAASNTLQYNQAFTSQSVHAVKVPRSIVPKGAITSPNALNYTLAAQIVPADQIITTSDIEQDPLIPTNGQQIVPISSQWIAAINGTLRLGDYVSIAPVSSGNIPTVTSSSKNPVTVQAPPSALPGLDHILVEFVQSGSNQEVTNASPSNSNAPSVEAGGTLGVRQDGSATPSTVELLLNAQQKQTLEAAVDSNEKLWISYVPNK